MTDKIDISAEAVLREAQKFIDEWFNNPGTARPEITIPAQDTNTDIALTKGIRALAARLADLEAERDHAWQKVADADARAIQCAADALDAQANLAKAVEALRIESDYWIKRADADIADQSINERILDYPTQRKMTEAMRKADALVAVIAEIGCRP